MKKINMSRTLAAGILASTFALAACGPVNRGVESVNQPVISRADYVLDVNAAALAAPGSSEAKRLDAWFAALNLGYGDRVSIDDPLPYGHEEARATIGAVLADHGLLLSDATPVTPGAQADGGMRVVVSRSTAGVPGCPNWDRPSQPEFDASAMSNFGCAVNTNLVQMVANPEDLVRGQEARGSDARTVTKAIKTYRDTAPTGAQALKTDSTGGK
ncbi:hypothetical protein ACFB49_31320 [Sphingomonas sp. DBB INV C78]|uniref:CpaD family pilus assembly protein n=1 Tax=Sphingomonas sp. DBB INV C78 TaxID=3349434 RepID=UPI0036D36FEF